MTRYVCTFIFNADNDEVLLVRKTHPQWQAGLRNGIGGHINANESPTAAAVREIREECGLRIGEGKLKRFCSLSGRGYQVEFFAARLHWRRFEKARTTTDEVIEVQRPDNLSRCIPNLRWLIPMALFSLSPCERVASNYYNIVEVS